MRRFAPGWERHIAGLRFRVVPGKKANGDLRLDWETPTGWRAVPMSVGFLLADFLHENEEALKAAGYFPGYAVGGDYYLRQLRAAVDEGWEAATNRLAQQRQERAARTASEPVLASWCRVPEPEGTGVCTKQMGHTGAHEGPGWIWPQAAA
jgi:hypothetical protein